MSILVTPRATEKAYGQTRQNTYVFDVPMTANKNEIADAVALQYEVVVKNVKTLIQSGKSVRFSRGKNRYPGTTTRKDRKKAYVTLAEGSSIQVFEESAATETPKEKK